MVKALRLQIIIFFLEVDCASLEEVYKALTFSGVAASSCSPPHIFHSKAVINTVL
jgi:hypothetical protein